MSNLPNPNPNQGASPAPDGEDTITIPSPSTTPEEYRKELRHAVLDVLKLVFERGVLDLQEDECFSIYLLVDLADNL